MIPIFDLDDTLYPESSYVESGFHAVARWGENQFGWPHRDSVDRLTRLLWKYGRGRVFDLWLEGHGVRPTRRLVSTAVHAYRHHDPEIVLPTAHQKLLKRLRAKGPVYLVTDGHKVVQSKKVEALGIKALFSGIYITHRYGLLAAKPSARCFELIKQRENASWQDIVYVGDNPAKDFVTLNKLGSLTVRVLTGRHATDRARDGFDGARHIKSLAELESTLFEYFR